MALLSCRDLALSYDGRTVLQNLSFSVERGDWLCVVGENGSGKSTLVRAILGLKKPDAGEIIRDPSLLHGGIGYLPQTFSVRPDFPATVFEVVLSGLQGKRGFVPFYTAAQKKRAREAMADLGVTAFADANISELSGGQRQRALLARALSATESLLVLDEPVTGLDPLVTHELYHLIRGLNREGLAVLMVSHDVRDAVRFASHILHLQKTPLFYGSAADYAKSPAARSFLSEAPHV